MRQRVPATDSPLDSMHAYEKAMVEAVDCIRLLGRFDARMTELGRCADGGNLNDPHLVKLIAGFAGMIDPVIP